MLCACVCVCVLGGVPMYPLPSRRAELSLTSVVYLLVPAQVFVCVLGAGWVEHGLGLQLAHAHACAASPAALSGPPLVGLSADAAGCLITQATQKAPSR